MLGENRTPFRALAFEQYHRDGPKMGVIVVRAAYELFPDGSLMIREKQELVLADEYELDPLKTPLLRPSDLTPFKPNTDITAIGYTYPPGGQRSGFWRFGMKIGQASASFACYGLRNWFVIKEQTGRVVWRMSEPTPVDRVPLDYRYATSDRILGKVTDGDIWNNPLGVPCPDCENMPHDGSKVVPIAMIFRDHDVVTYPDKPVKIASTAPVAPHWGLRQRFAGTYDKQWKENRYPLLPRDFDYLFYQTACPGMIYRGFMRGDEDMELYQMTAGQDVVRLKLPGIRLVARLLWLDGRNVDLKLNLDGIHFDLRSSTPPWRVDFTWRGWAEICPQFFKIDLDRLELDDPLLAAMMSCDVDGLSEGGN